MIPQNNQKPAKGTFVTAIGSLRSNLHSGIHEDTAFVLALSTKHLDIQVEVQSMMMLEKRRYSGNMFAI